MKKIMFLLFAFFGFLNLVYAKTLYIEDFYFNEYDETQVFTNEDVIHTYGASFPADLFLAYFDKEGNLLESYGFSSNDGSFNSISELNFNLGYSCQQMYNKFKPDSVSLCSLGQLGIYSSGKSLDEVKYWKKKEFYNPHMDSDSYFYDFCDNYEETHNSRICSDLIFKSSFDYGNFWSYIGFVEYEPVTFNLICEDENLKSGEEVSCKLKVNAEEEIKEFTIATKNDLYEIVNYSEVEGWKILDNKNGTITVKSDAGFKGINYAVSFKFKLADNKTENVNLEIKDFDYTIYDGNVLKSSTSDNVSIKKDEVVNPNTKDFNVILVVFIVSFGCLGIIALKPKKIYS